MKYEKHEAGEIWVQFKNSKEFNARKQEFENCVISDFDKRLNTCSVRIYIKDENKVFGYSYSCTPKTADRFRNVFGAENVKFIPTEPAIIPVREYGEKENIERIANALERIAEALNQGR